MTPSGSRRQRLIFYPANSSTDSAVVFWALEACAPSEGGKSCTQHPIEPTPDIGADAPARPRIYVACLAAYNTGMLYGQWITATTPEDVQAEV